MMHQSCGASLLSPSHSVEWLLASEIELDFRVTFSSRKSVAIGRWLRLGSVRVLMWWET